MSRNPGAIIAGILLTALSAKAGIVTLAFSAPLDYVDSAAANIFTLGDLATIRYTFDTATPGSGSYLAISLLELTIDLHNGGTYSASAPVGLIQIQDNYTGWGSPVDHYFAGATNQDLFQLSAPPVNEKTVTGVYLSLWDTSAKVFTSTALPASIDPSAFVPNGYVPLEGISLRFGSDSAPDFVSASLNQTSGQVPEPSGLFVFVLTLPMLCAFKARQLRRRRIGV
jgi:hypothetical protein